MTTDREMLEMAAKGAGISLANLPFIHNRGDGALTAGGDLWNPLADDGDALRLAVKLGLHIITKAFGEGNGTYTRALHKGAEGMEPHGDDPDAATRRAIVRAAATIGAKTQKAPRPPKQERGSSGQD